MTTKTNEKGFTIIEVLIVLAIAGLIMVIVFLAVPALQRNSRNTQRTNDASRTVAAINECTNNKNGNLGSCDSEDDLEDYINFAQNQQLTNYGAAAAGLNAMRYQNNTQCNDAGDDTQAGGGTRAFTITYLIETSAASQTRCIQG